MGLVQPFECLVIPNEEVQEEFVLAVTKGKHTKLAKLIRNSDQLLEQTLNMDERADAGQMPQAAIEKEKFRCGVV